MNTTGKTTDWTARAREAKSRLLGVEGAKSATPAERKNRMLNESECVELCEQLAADASQLEANLIAAKIEFPARPITADIVEEAERMSAHVAALRDLLGMASGQLAAVNRAEKKAARKGTSWTQRAIAARQQSRTTPTASLAELARREADLRAELAVENKRTLATLGGGGSQSSNWPLKSKLPRRRRTK